MSRLSRLAVVLALCLCVPLATGCSSDDSADNSGATNQEQEVVLTDDDVDVDDLDDEDDDDIDDEDDDADDETQEIGAEGIGFVDVPATWVKFEDTDGNDSIQYCDGTPYTIISLNTFDLDSVPEDERADFDAEDAANAVWNNMLNDGADEESVTGAHVTLAGRDALQVYGVYPDGGYLVCWLAEDDQGAIRYVAAEGTKDTIMDAVGYVEGSYEF